MTTQKMNTDPAKILDDILQTISLSENPDQALNQVVNMVAQRFGVDVCSVYTYDPSGNTLMLRATVGLNPSSVGGIEMDVNEGLTGLVVETMAPVFVVNPSSHPRFKFYNGSGEELFKTFLGLPLIYHRKVLGVLILQTRDEQGISEKDIPLFKSIAGQISSTVAYIRLQEERYGVDRTKTGDPARSRSTPALEKEKISFVRGDPVSDLTAMGSAHYIAESIDFGQIHCKSIDNPDKETLRLEKAFFQAAEQIKAVIGNAQGIPEQQKAVLDAHVMFLSDKSLRSKITAAIRKGNCAEYALKMAILDYVDMFRSLDDTYLSERAADIMDIGLRVLTNLMGVNDDPEPAFFHDTILVASDISPVDLLAIRQPNLKGIVLAKGGKTSHTVIMAKSLEIPIVVGVDGILDSVREKDFLIVDGASGLVFINPSPEIRNQYEQRRAQDQKDLEKLEVLREIPAITLDGHEIHLGANIGLLSDMRLAQKYGAEYIGLYRTEFPFLLRTSFPSEEDQVNLYTRMLRKSENRIVSIRTFDVGGDKFLPYLDAPREDNPFLGWRSIRISLDLEDVFKTQIRAILRASAFGKAKILFPMITGIEEIHRILALVEGEKKTLDAAGIVYDPDIQLGIMVEVPAAIPILDRILRYMDFVNIGTNDLVQYLLAVDRNNKKVSARYNALHPSVITAISEVVAMCNRLGKPVDICGEAASSRECVFLFVGMGATHFSMTPASIPVIKNFILSISRKEAEEALKTCLRLEEAGTIFEFIHDVLGNRIRRLVQ